MKSRIRNASIALPLCILLGGSLYGCASTPEHESTGQYIDDATITTKVKSKLLEDSITEGLKISVETERAIVLLSGFVNTAEQKERAGELAQSVAGVKSVRNDLAVK